MNQISPKARFGTFPWSPEVNAELKQMIEVDLLGSYAIAGILSEKYQHAITPKAVQSKADRLGLKFSALAAPKPRPRFWSDEIIAKVKQLYIEDRLSAYVVAELMGADFTAGSIRSASRRYGWDRDPMIAKAASANTRASRGPALRARAADQVQVTVEMRAGAFDQMGVGKPWLERASRECCWPVSGAGAETYSCCEPVTFKLDGSPHQYCKHHKALSAHRRDSWARPGTPARLLLIPPSGSKSSA